MKFTPCRGGEDADPTYLREEKPSLPGERKNCLRKKADNKLRGKLSSSRRRGGGKRGSTQVEVKGKKFYQREGEK